MNERDNLINLGKASSKKNWISQEQAIKKTETYKRQYGRLFYDFACFAALPLFVTPELVNLIYNNFFDITKVPWYVCAEFLISPLCTYLYDDIYEINPGIRDILLDNLIDNFSIDVAKDIAGLLYEYVNKKKQSQNNVDFIQVQEWIALSYINQDSAIEKISETFEKSFTEYNNFFELQNQMNIVNTVEIVEKQLKATNKKNELKLLTNSTRLIASYYYNEDLDFRKAFQKNDVLMDKNSGDQYFLPVVVKWAVKEKENELEEKTDGMIYLNESRIFIIGNQGAGKTSLIKRITKGQHHFDFQETATSGIKVTDWHFRDGTIDDFTAHIWSFGGRLNHYTFHKLFFSKKSLYILLWDAGSDDDLSFHYWLNLISILSETSPVIIVQNKIDQYQKNIDEISLKGIYSNIIGFHNISLKENYGVQELIDFISYQATNLPQVYSKVPRVWHKMKEALLRISKKNNYIPYSEYEKECAKYELTREQAYSLCSYYHNLGICFFFKKNSVIKDTIFLSADWIAEAVIKVLENAAIFKKMGNATVNDFQQSWSDYPRELAIHLIEILKEIDVCFQIGSTSEYIIPDFLPEKQPENSWNKNNTLQITYQYSSVIRSILPHLIANMHNLIKDNIYWKNGAVFKQGESEVLVLFNILKGTLSIYCQSSDKDKLLSIIRNEIKSINQKYSPFKVKEMIACICDECQSEPHMYDYDDLIPVLLKNKINIECPKSADDVNIGRLLEKILTIEDFIELIKLYLLENLDIQDINNLYGEFGKKNDFEKDRENVIIALLHKVQSDYSDSIPYLLNSVQKIKPQLEETIHLLRNVFNDINPEKNEDIKLVLIKDLNDEAVEFVIQNFSNEKDFTNLCRSLKVEFSIKTEYKTRIPSMLNKLKRQSPYHITTLYNGLIQLKPYLKEEIDFIFKTSSSSDKINLQMNEIRKTCIGISLGLTNSAVACYQGKLAVTVQDYRGSGSCLIPSMLARLPGNKEWIFGQDAKNQAVTNPEGTIHIMRSLIYNQGTDEAEINGNKIMIEELLSLFINYLKKLTDSAGAADFKRAVISIPALSGENRFRVIRIIRSACESIGLEVLDIIQNDSIPIQLQYIDKKCKIFAVINFGETSYTVSIYEAISRGSAKLLAQCRDFEAGGIDADDLLIKWICTKFYDQYKIDLLQDALALQRLKESCEITACELAKKNSYEINQPFITGAPKGPLHLQISITRNEYETLSAEIMQKLRLTCEEVIQEASILPSDIEKIFILAYDKRIHLVTRTISQLWTAPIVNDLDNPDELAAKAALLSVL